MALVSIIITYYNESNLLPRAVKSALSQDIRPDVEVIVVDDGSMVFATSILRELKVKNIKIIRQKNQGLGAARDVGVCHSKGKWVTFLDADDEIVPSKVSRQIKCIKNIKNQKAVIFTGSKILPSGRLKWVINGKQCIDITEDVFQGRMPSGASMLLERSLYFEVGGFDREVRRQSEMLIIAKLYAIGSKFFIVPEPLYYQTIHKNNNRRKTTYRIESLQMVIKKVKNIFMKQGLENCIHIFFQRRLIALLKMGIENRSFHYSYKLLKLFYSNNLLSREKYNLLHAYVAVNKATWGIINKISSIIYKLFKEKKILYLSDKDYHRN
jgi:glycosyltransferase involved in cell wall biosynthesis